LIVYDITDIDSF